MHCGFKRFLQTQLSFCVFLVPNYLAISLKIAFLKKGAEIIFCVVSRIFDASLVYVC